MTTLFAMTKQFHFERFVEVFAHSIAVFLEPRQAFDHFRFLPFKSAQSKFELTFDMALIHVQQFSVFMVPTDFFALSLLLQAWLDTLLVFL